jgi:acetyl-CoA carboxylase biotin carboxyl carrier protein
MTPPAMTARIACSKDPGDCVEIQAPAVGYFSALIQAGAYVDHRAPFGTLQILAKRYRLVLPPEASGWVAEQLIEAKQAPVAYGQPLLRLRRGAPDRTGVARGPASDDDQQSAAQESLLAVKAPSDGVFYRRAAPDAPPFVEVGSVIQPGQMLGLIEVMKCFHQITYAEPDSSRQATVVEILAGDAAEVQVGMTLFWLKPS